MLIDTHAHLNFKAYDKDRDQVIARCQKKPLAVINVGAQLATSKQAVELTEKNENFYASVGLHPIHVFDEPFKPQEYQKLITNKTVAIGETGFDFWHLKHLAETYKIILLHGWDGSKDERFFIWLDKELTGLGHQVIRFNFPEAANPRQEAWLKEIDKQAPYVNGKTLIVGFSLGGVTTLRFLEALAEDSKIGGAFLLGAPFDDLGYPELADFFKSGFNWEKLNSVCPSFNIYNSTNDEVVPPEHGQKFAAKLKTDIKLIEGAWHFTVEKLPQLLEDIKKRIGEIEKELPSGEQVITKQKEVFLQHIKLAKDNNLPLILHGRNGIEGRNVYLEMLEILNQHKVEKAVFHFYGGDSATARQIVKNGFYLGADGPLTFLNKAEELQKIVKEIPLENFLMETDSPYLTPEPHRGERNEPVYVEYVAEKIAEIKNLSKEEVIEQTWQNAKRLFGIK